MPTIVTSVIGLVGILVIISTLQLAVLWGCLALLALMVLVYVASARWNFSFNKAYNDELEERVTDPILYWAIMVIWIGLSLTLFLPGKP